jgi:hypothetical protein
MARDGFRTKTGKPVRMRVTLTVEAGSQADLEKALDEAALLGKDRYMGISYHWKRKGGARVSCRTVIARPARRPTNGTTDIEG